MMNDKNINDKITKDESEILYSNVDYIHKSENITPDTPTIIHVKGSGGGIDETFNKSKELSKDRDATIVFLEDNNEKLVEEFHCEFTDGYQSTDNVSFAAHSAGAKTSLQALAAAYEAGYQPDQPPTVVLLDPSFNNVGQLSEREMQILAENDVQVIAYYQMGSQTAALEKMGKAGINIAMYRNYTDRGHNLPCLHFYENEYNLFDFLYHNEALMQEEAKMGASIWKDGQEVYNTGPNNYDISEVNTMEKLDKLWEINRYNYQIESLKKLKDATATTLGFAINSNDFDANLNNVLSTIGQTSYLYNSINVSTDSSVTTVAQASSLVENFFKTNTDLLTSIAKEMKEYKNISPAFSVLDEKMEQSAIELKNNIPTHIKPMPLKSTKESIK